MEKLAKMAPNGARKMFFLLIQTLPTFWAEQIWILRVSIFVFLGPQHGPGFGPAWARAWARLGPGLGPGLGLGFGPGLGPGLGPDAALYARVAYTTCNWNCN